EPTEVVEDNLVSVLLFQEPNFVLKSLFGVNPLSLFHGHNAPGEGHILLNQSPHALLYGLDILFNYGLAVINLAVQPVVQGMLDMHRAAGDHLQGSPDKKKDE